MSVGTSRRQQIIDGTSGLPEWKRRYYLRAWKLLKTAQLAGMAQTERTGPGTELKGLLAELRLTGWGGCGCEDKARQMDEWGVEGCRQREPIIGGWLRDSAAAAAWSDKVRAGLRATTVIPAEHWTDPIPWIVTEAIRRAEAKLQIPRPAYITSERLTKDTLSLIPQLPPDLSAICGVARSGMMPATLLAMHLHLPLYTLDQDGEVRECGHGWRLRGRKRTKGPVLIMDDTVGSGTSLSWTKEVAPKFFDEPVYANVYVNPLATRRPDLWAYDLYLPHILEWNFCNSIVASVSAFDLDGILCHDEYSGGPPGTPYLLPRREPIHIITGRSEKHRAGTLAWLDHWGIRVASLTMKPTGDPRTFAEYKAQAVKRFASTEHQRPYGRPVYVESCPDQAKRIAELSGVLTVCPITREVLGPEGCWR